MSREGPADRSSARRCPACGQRLVPPYPSRCPLCEFEFAKGAVTGADVTPYARAYVRGSRGWRRMCEWVWYAGSGRLKHLALMQASAASRRFLFLNTLLFAAAVALLEGTQIGWRRVTASAALEPTGSTQPAGKGWFQVAAAPDSLLPGLSSDVPVHLWWNPAQALIAVAIGGVAALVGFRIMMGLMAGGTTRMHRPPYRDELRMTAAIHYSTAWVIPLFLAGIIALPSALDYFRTVSRWSWCPPARVFELSAAVFAAFGLSMWWFWLVRLGATAPARTRGHVIAFLALMSPVLLVAGSGAWWFGVNAVYDWLFAALDIRF